MAKPKIIALSMVRSRSKNSLCPARDSSREETRNPRPVKEITPYIIPAEAQATVTGMLLRPASVRARTILPKDIRVCFLSMDNPRSTTIDQKADHSRLQPASIMPTRIKIGGLRWP